MSWWEQRTAIISRGVSAGDMNRSGFLWNPYDWVFCFYSLVSMVSLSEHQDSRAFTSPGEECG